MNVPTSGFRKFLVAVTFFVLIGHARQALASGDMGCSPAWRLLHRSYEGCNNMAFLAPSNDTRVNLLLLLADLRAVKVGASLKPNAKAEAPLFEWGSLVGTFDPQPETPTSQTAGTDGQSSTPCPPTLPANDPFTLAVQADRQRKPEERDALLEARKKTQSGCAADGATSATTHAETVAKTASAKAYALYLEGAAAFWRGEYDKAGTTFSSLTSAQPAWVRETATYMVGRALINRAQAGAFDEYGSFAKDWHADATIIAKTEAALDAYLRQYPKGVYAQSSRGLKRRGYWLAKDTAKLEAEYGTLLLLSPQERNLSDVDLLQEIDNKLTTPTDNSGAYTSEGLLNSAQSPFLLAMLDLQAMRTEEQSGAGSSAGEEHALSLSTLQQQKQYFAEQMPLYEYLLAVHAFYIEHKPADVLRMIPDATHQGAFSYVQFSRQVLRGMALEAVKDHNALGFWMQMLPGAQAAYQRPVLELAIAYHQERAGQVRSVFAADSPVHYPYLRVVLLVNVADADLLRTQATNTSAPQRERDIALFTLLYKEATHGDAAAFLKDVALVPSDAAVGDSFLVDDYADRYDSMQPTPIPVGIYLHDKTSPTFSCPGLRKSEEQLVQDATNTTAQLCVAEFVRLNAGVTYLGSAIDPADQLGGTPPLFPGGNYTRMDTYKSVAANAKASRTDKAYALYRAVNCYAPSGNNDCGGADVPKAQRKAWFTSLKRDYADTRWAKELQYYW